MISINFVRQGAFMLIQFNSSCDEALPVCQANCCRLRKYYSVDLTEEEATRLKTQTIYKIEFGVTAGPFGERKVLAGTPEGDCVYLKDNRCSIYETRPKACREWHCSPQGGLGDSEITKREQGWVLFPAREAK